MGSEEWTLLQILNNEEQPSTQTAWALYISVVDKNNPIVISSEGVQYYFPVPNNLYKKMKKYKFCITSIGNDSCKQNNKKVFLNHENNVSEMNL